MKTGIELIAEERHRQIVEEKFDLHHDNNHDRQELAYAAIAYAMPSEETERIHFWPWELDWWKPTPENRVRELVKAGALIAAQIDRLQAAPTKREGEK